MIASFPWALRSSSATSDEEKSSAASRGAFGGAADGGCLGRRARANLLTRLRGAKFLLATPILLGLALHRWRSPTPRRCDDPRECGSNLRREECLEGG